MVAAIVNRYFNKLARCGKACLESQNRRMHCNDRQVGGRAAIKPGIIEFVGSHRVGPFHETAYKQKNSSAFCQGHVSIDWEHTAGIGHTNCCGLTVTA
jgi:hypothetical protein